MSEPSGLSPCSATGARRPAAVSLVALLAVLAGGYLVIDGVLGARDVDREDTGEIAYTALQIALALIMFAIAFGALRVKPWGWKLFMTLAVVGLTTQILQHFFFGDPRSGRMAVYAVIVFALTPRDVQVAFRIRLPANVELGTPTRNPLDRD